jgi:phosphotransferase system HPr (HPr) family protein
MALPSSHANNLRNGTDKLEKEIVVRKRHYVWSEARFVRAMMPFHSNVRVAHNGAEVDGKNVLDLMTLAPPQGSTVRVRAGGARRGRGTARARRADAIARSDALQKFGSECTVRAI